MSQPGSEEPLASNSIEATPAQTSWKQGNKREKRKTKRKVRQRKRVRHRRKKKRRNCFGSRESSTSRPPSYCSLHNGKCFLKTILMPDYEDKELSCVGRCLKTISGIPPHLWRGQGVATWWRGKWWYSDVIMCDMWHDDVMMWWCRTQVLSDLDGCITVTLAPEASFPLI